MFGKYGKTKAELKREKNIPESAIYNWLRGDTTPSTDNAVLIAEFFGCSFVYLVGWEI